MSALDWEWTTSKKKHQKKNKSQPQVALHDKVLFEGSGTQLVSSAEEDAAAKRKKDREEAKELPPSLEYFRWDRDKVRILCRNETHPRPACPEENNAT